jgi:hypothetical protein
LHWAGQAGQPTYLWGSNDGANSYVWNPSNFSVNYATTAGAANSVAWTNVTGRPNYASSVVYSNWADSMTLVSAWNGYNTFYGSTSYSYDDNNYEYSCVTNSTSNYHGVVTCTAGVYTVNNVKYLGAIVQFGGYFSGEFANSFNNFGAWLTISRRPR